MILANQENFGQRATELRKLSNLTQKQLADQLGVSITSVQKYEAGRVPNGEILVKLAAALGCTSEWLVTGEGEMMRGATVVEQLHRMAHNNIALDALKDMPGLGKSTASIYNDKEPARRDISIADALAKTAKVLESDTVYREALYSNIEAFHHGVTMDERLSQMDAKFDQVMQRLDAVESTNKRLETENAQLRKELEKSRVQDDLEHTG